MTKAGDSEHGYGVVSMANHWIIGTAVIVVLFVGLLLAGMDGADPRKGDLRNLHKFFGVIVLALALWRIVWRAWRGFPKAPPDHPRWRVRAATAMHWFLMIAIVAMPLSGLVWSLAGGRDVSVFDVISIPALPRNEGLADAAQSVHRLFSKALIAAIALHALAGIYAAATDAGRFAGRMFIPK